MYFYFQESPLQNLSEVRASTVEKAALYLDAALSGRSRDSLSGREAHLLYTLHVYQYSLHNGGGGPGGVAGGRSRLHLLDLGGCDGNNGGLTLSGLGNVLIGIFNGQKHLPCRHSKLTGVLRDCLGSLTCHATMLAHVSTEPERYAETLHTLQLAARIHRTRRKRIKTSGGSRGSNSSGERRARGSGSSGSDFTKSATSTDPSSSELSCSTVIYRGIGGGLSEDGSGTDGEHPPPPMSALNGGGRRRFAGGSRILTNGTISPSSSRLTLSSSSAADGLQSPRRGLTPTLPAIREFNGHFNLLPLSQPGVGPVAALGGGKMPLNGQVPGYRQPAEIWIDGHRNPYNRTNGSNAERPPSQHFPSPPAPLQPNPLATAQTGPEEMRQYGYMDAYKASMICNWVETQADAKFLTQFKQAADSTSDSGSEHRLPVNTEVRADVHQQGQPSATSPQQSPKEEVELLVLDDGGVRRGIPPQPPPRRLSPSSDGGNAQIGMSMIEEEEEGVVGMVVEAASDTSIEPLPEPDFEALDSRVFFSGKNK